MPQITAAGPRAASSRLDFWAGSGSTTSPCTLALVSARFTYRLYDEDIPASKALVQKWTAFNNRYRVVLHADIVHLKRADGNGMDAMLHVQPEPTKSKERAFLMLFNQNKTHTWP